MEELNIIRNAPQFEFSYLFFPDLQKNTLKICKSPMTMTCKLLTMHSQNLEKCTGKVHHVNQWVKNSETTLLPGLCTSGKISIFMTTVSVGNIFPNVQRPGSGVVGFVLTHWLTWCPYPHWASTIIQKKLDRCVSKLSKKIVFLQLKKSCKKTG